VLLRGDETWELGSNSEERNENVHFRFQVLKIYTYLALHAAIVSGEKTAGRLLWTGQLHYYNKPVLYPTAGFRHTLSVISLAPCWSGAGK